MGYVTSLFARKVIAAAGSTVDAAELLTEAGLSSDAPLDPKVMLRDTVYYDLLEGIAQQTDATALPLRVGASMLCDEYGALGLAWKAAPTLGGSFARVERYARLWTSVVEYELRQTDRGVLYILHRSGPRRLGMRLSNEATIASTVSLCRQVTSDAFTPLEVRFKHSAPASITDHEAFFGCPVRFDADLDALLISPEAMAQPTRLGDEGITQFLLSHLEAELRSLRDEPSLEAMTKDAIARSLSEGLPKVADIARSLGMSARSFQRRLSEHGLSYQTLTETTRRELAEGLMKDEQYSLSEIAFLTGFSEQSAFTRAFKRWAGQTPASYRKMRI
ncbi:AraC family transcriptional regulator [Tropicimonas sp. S265A]|uniref:AraC family transcriptional regulator n=1 Tax=Tropicimonas sp. S265A TaxID=3415134 RepID=UPI003C7E37B0